MTDCTTCYLELENKGKEMELREFTKKCRQDRILKMDYQMKKLM